MSEPSAAGLAALAAHLHAKSCGNWPCSCPQGTDDDFAKAAELIAVIAGATPTPPPRGPSTTRDAARNAFDTHPGGHGIATADRDGLVDAILTAVRDDLAEEAADESHALRLVLASVRSEQTALLSAIRQIGIAAGPFSLRSRGAAGASVGALSEEQRAYLIEALSEPERAFWLTHQDWVRARADEGVLGRALKVLADVPESNGDVPFPTQIVVFCDECGLERAGDYLVLESDSSETRLGYARTFLSTQHWHIAPGVDLCPTHNPTRTSKGSPS